MVSIIFTLENADKAGTVVYIIAINTNAQPAEIRASFTRGTVKKRTITCGKPAVPNINAPVIKNTSIMSLEPSVY